MIFRRQRNKLKVLRDHDFAQDGCHWRNDSFLTRCRRSSDCHRHQQSSFHGAVSLGASVPLKWRRGKRDAPSAFHGSQTEPHSSQGWPARVPRSVPKSQPQRDHDFRNRSLPVGRARMPRLTQIVIAYNLWFKTIFPKGSRTHLVNRHGPGLTLTNEKSCGPCRGRCYWRWIKAPRRDRLPVAHWVRERPG